MAFWNTFSLVTPLLHHDAVPGVESNRPRGLSAMLRANECHGEACFTWHLVDALRLGTKSSNKRSPTEGGKLQKWLAQAKQEANDPTPNLKVCMSYYHFTAMPAIS